MAIRFEPKTPEAQKQKPVEPTAAPPELPAERAKPAKTKGKSSARGDKPAGAKESDE